MQGPLLKRSGQTKALISQKNCSFTFSFTFWPVEFPNDTVHIHQCLCVTLIRSVRF